ncbi:alpha/beta fold hydrolase [Gemmatimonas sp.]
MSTPHARHMQHDSSRDSSPLPNPLGGERRVFEWRGQRIAYVVRGHGDPVVFIHSIHAAAWNAEWRHVVPALEEHTCYALDLLGFGASDRPAVHYTAQLYLQLIHDFLVEVVGEPALLVGSSLGGTYAIAIAADYPQLARGVVAIGPGGISRLFKQGGAPFGVIENTFRLPVLGEWLFSALVSRASIRFFLKDIYANGLDAEAEALYWVSANQPNARFAPAAFVGMNLNWDVRDRVAQLACPLLIAWGTKASQTPYREAAEVRRRAPRAQFAPFDAGDLPHDEVPIPFVAALKDFAAKTPAVV